MSETYHCRHCGTSFTSDTAQGLCPACLLEQGLGQGLGPPPADETQAMAPGGRGGWSQAGYSHGGYGPGVPGMQGVPGMEEPTLAEVGRLFPQLEVIELLGRGGMGIVYKARQRGLDRLVALKILPPGVDRDPGFQERFVREARALARLGDGAAEGRLNLA